MRRGARPILQEAASLETLVLNGEVQEGTRGRGAKCIPTHALWLEILNRRDYLQNLGVNEKIILKRVLNKQDNWIWTTLTWLRIGAGCGRGGGK
jgi:hypothetical protein